MNPLPLIDGIHRFLETGGPVLWIILTITFIMWLMILERYLFYYVQYPAHRHLILQQWQTASLPHHWYQQQLRRRLISETRLDLQRHLLTIKTITVILPMLGLLGTVSGMISTFDVMAIFGTGNTRGMASGISKALITTMAGLLTAISGLYFSAHLGNREVLMSQQLSSQLLLDTPSQPSTL